MNIPYRYEKYNNEHNFYNKYIIIYLLGINNQDQHDSYCQD